MSWGSAHLERCPLDPPLTDFQTLTNSRPSCVRQALISRELSTFRFHIRSEALTSSGISRSEASCGYQPSSELKTPTFSIGFELRLSGYRSNMHRRTDFKFRSRLGLSPEFDKVLSAVIVRFGPKADLPGYSITSSARESNCGGTVRPSALAVLRLITSSNLVGACTGKSPGFSPFRIRST